MSKTQQLLEIAHENTVIRAKDVEALGIHRQYLKRLCELGLLIHSGRGIYTCPSADITSYHSLVEVTQRVERGVICLLSALNFYQITTEAPFEVWLAISRSSRPPQDKLLPMRIVYMSEETLIEGVEINELQGVKVKVFSLAKTIVDCFKYRQKIGLDIALNALKESWIQKRIQIDEIWYYAKICRVKTVIRPYLESLVNYC